MCAWFSHMSTMVYAIVRIHNDTEYNHKLTPCCYEGAGWPFFEYNVAHWCKEEQTEMSYTLSNGQMASFWQMISVMEKLVVMDKKRSKPQASIESQKTELGSHSFTQGRRSVRRHVVF